MKAHRDELRPREAKVLRAIEAALRRDGQAPTIREIGAAVRIASTSHVVYLLGRLEEKGHIEREHGSRGIRLAHALGVPILGRIAAGEPLDLYAEDDQEQLDLGAHVRAAGPEGEYALMVRGDSMIDDHIYDGDFVLVHPAHSASDGAIVVAQRRDAVTGAGAATIKRFYLEQRHHRVRLQPANTALEPIFISTVEWGREWEIRGIVTAVYRPCR